MIIRNASTLDSSKPTLLASAPVLSDLNQTLDEIKESNTPTAAVSTPRRKNQHTTHCASGLILEKEVDLSKYPISHGVTLTSTDRLTQGDLHGNAIKLLYFLIHENVITGINKDDYQILANIYHAGEKRELNKEDIEKFIHVISKIRATNAGSSPLITLIGDVLADRGCNDYFTLKILQQLILQNIPVEILLSNHDREFLGAYERGKLQNQIIKPAKGWPLYMRQRNSLNQFSSLIARNIVTMDEATHLIKDFYLPSLRGIGYSIDNKHKEIAFFTHAPVNLGIIPKIAKQFSLNLSTTDPLSPKTVAENINIVNKKLDELCNRDNALHGSSPEYSPLHDLMWYRLDKLNKTDTRKNDCIEKDWKTIYVHGHNGNGINPKIDDNKQVVNLDNSLGKLPLRLDRVSKYTVYYSGYNEKFLQERNIAVAKLKEPEQVKKDKNKIRTSFFNPSLSAQYGIYSIFKLLEKPSLVLSILKKLPEKTPSP